MQSRMGCSCLPHMITSGSHGRLSRRCARWPARSGRPFRYHLLLKGVIAVLATCLTLVGREHRGRESDWQFGRQPTTFALLPQGAGVAGRHHLPQTRRGRHLAEASVVAARAAASAPAEASKAELLAAIAQFDAIKARDGNPSVDFGVRGGELNRSSRAPSNLAADGAFYRVSKELGETADKVLDLAKSMEAQSPNPKATEFLGTPEGKRCPLHGRWELLFTTAGDATFSRNSTRGDARVANEVDAVAGKVTNCIDFVPGESPSAVESLRVKLSATPTSERRVELAFKYVQARVRKLFGLPLFGRTVTLTLPVPGPFLSRIIFFFTRKQPPKPYFDVLYLDDTLRIHQTGEGNIFIQKKASSTPGD